MSTPPNETSHHGRLGSVWRYALALLISVVAWVASITSVRAAVGEDSPVIGWLVLGDTALGLVSFGLLRWRHRWPLTVAVVTNLLTVVSTTSAGPSSWAIGSIAARHRWRVLTWLVPLAVLVGVAQEKLFPGDDDLPLWASLLFGALIVGIIVAVGWAMGSQRNLMASLRDRAETAEREQQARVARAQTAERTRIAREMHDVLAHRISLVAMHAGALSYRTDLTAEEQATAAKTIEENAHRALTDLREVLGVLRDPALSSGAPEAPQPQARDLPRLVEEARSGGMRVTLEDSTTGDVPDAAARTAYRVVQEALTNARKHAAGTSVTVRLTGSEEDGLDVSIRNAAPVGNRATTLPESGLGLLGLQERVALAGGRLRHGTDASGGFAVSAWIPWHP